MNDLESVIRRYVILGKRSPKGFEPLKCAVCNDYKVRGGFKFEADHVAYKCFNCSTKAIHKTDAYEISDHFKSILLAFGIPEAEIKRSVAQNFFKPKFETQVSAAPAEQRALELPTREVPLPTGSVKISTDDSPWCEVARLYLSSRGLNHLDYTYYVTDETSYAGRLLIPYYFKGRIVYWQGRSMDESIQPRYKNPIVEKDNIFFNMDEVYRYTDEPLFVTEGSLDSLSIGSQATSILGSDLSEFRVRELRRAAQRRKVIFVIDKNLNGKKLGERALSEGWYVTCFPDNYDDANDVLQKLGRLWLITHLSTTAVTGFEGKLLLKMRCSS